MKVRAPKRCVCCGKLMMPYQIAQMMDAYQNGHKVAAVAVCAACWQRSAQNWRGVIGRTG